MAFVFILNISLLLMGMSDYLFFITLAEILIAICYLIFIKISQKERKEKKRITTESVSNADN